jgi:hypothetical protein
LKKHWLFDFACFPEPLSLNYKSGETNRNITRRGVTLVKHGEAVDISVCEARGANRKRGTETGIKIALLTGEYERTFYKEEFARWSDSDNEVGKHRLCFQMKISSGF